MDVFSVVESATVVVTFLMMASGLPPCWNMLTTKSTRNVPFIFFLISTINCTFALYYGSLINNSPIIMINGVGLVLWGAYVLVYIYVARSKTKSIIQLGAGAAILLAHIVYLSHVIVVKDHIAVLLGKFLFLWSTVLLLTPALDIVDVVREKNSDGMPLSLLFGGTLCSAMWLLYGYLLKDFYIYGPNILGLVVSAGKFVVLFMFRGGSSQKFVKSG